MKILASILVGLALVVLVLGFSSSSGAPQEAVVAGIACLLGILARIAQANGYHYELIKQNENIREELKKLNENKPK